MKLPVDDVLPPVKFDFLLLDLRSLSGPCWFEICFDLSGSLLILSFVISFFGGFYLLFVFVIFSLSKNKHLHRKLTPLSRCIYLSAHLPFPNFNFSILIPLPPSLATAPLRLCCRIISSTWVSWGCSGQLVSSSCWGREKPSASCSGPSFNPSRFAPIYTEQCAQ